MKENDEGYMKENDADDRHTETLAMERLKELATSKALSLEGYLQPRCSHASLRSQWQLKLHQWPRTSRMAWSTERDHTVLGQILIDRIVDFHAQTQYTKSFHPLKETNPYYDRQAEKRFRKIRHTNRTWE